VPCGDVPFEFEMTAVAVYEPAVPNFLTGVRLELCVPSLNVHATLSQLCRLAVPRFTLKVMLSEVLQPPAEQPVYDTVAEVGAVQVLSGGGLVVPPVMTTLVVFVTLPFGFEIVSETVYVPELA